MGALLGGVAALLAGGGFVSSCDSSSRDPDSPGLAIAWVAYTDDGALLAASRERVVRLDANLVELDRTSPPFPFDPSVDQPGLQHFGASRDGHVVAMAWQDNYYSHSPPKLTLDAGATIFSVPTAAPLRQDLYPGATFQGMSLSPDGQITAAVNDNELLVTTVAGNQLLWQAAKTRIYPPRFTGDGAGLIVAASPYQVEVVRPQDGSTILSLAPPMPSDYDVDYDLVYAAASADGSTCAIYTVHAPQSGGTATIWRLSDGARLATIPMPLDLASAAPSAMALSPDGDRLAMSFVPGISDALLVWRGGQQLYRANGQTYGALAFSPDGTTLAAKARYHGLRLLRADDGALLAERILPDDASAR
jgi:hypothetical protein